MVGGEISFGRLRLDLARHELRRDNRAVRLGSRALDILCVLASADGAVVTKDELMARVWGGVVVEENNLQVHISALRKALEEGGNDESLIVTVPGRGYRLLRSPDQPAADTSVPAPGAPPPDKPSVAVLPFQNMSGDPEQEYFADGMVEEIITALSRIRWLFVIARNSTFTYKGQDVDVKGVGRELGVRYVLEGSVRRSGDRVRITAQLIDASTGVHLWADRFDGRLEDVFDLQDKVASSVAGVIEPALQAAETARSKGRSSKDLTAYDLYLRAHAMVWSSAGQIPAALGLLEQAVECDPSYGPALAWAAFCCYRLLLDGRSDAPAIDRLKGIDFARRALEVAGDDPITLTNAAQALAFFGEDIGAMMALVDRALALNPNFARGWHSSAALRLNAGQPDIAIEHVEAALRLSPGARVGTSLVVMGAAHFLARRFDEAVPKLLLAIEEDPSFPVPYRYLAACYSHMGRLAEAREILGRLRAISSVVIPDASHLRNVEQRELFLSGLQLATGKSRSIDEVRRRGDRLLRSPEPTAADKSAPGPSVPVPDRPSVAVLPFQNMSGDPEQEYFVDGMVEEIITALSRIRWLFVIARNSSFSYKGQSPDVRQVGRELGARYVLEGSVRKAGDRVRITGQLIDAQTGAHLWADRFDGSLEDVFYLQETVASRVAGVIEPALQAAEAAHSADRPTDDLTAYDLYLRAYAMVWSSAKQIPEALRLLELAIARDPHYGPALAWAAYCCVRLLRDDRSEDPEAESLKGADFARRALEVAGDDPSVLANAAQALAYLGEDIGATMALVDRALTLNPSFARGWHISGTLRDWSGQPDIAIDHAEVALRLSPRARVGPSFLVIGAAHFYSGRFDEAVPKLLLAIQEDPSFPAPYRILAACYAHMGRLDDAREIVERLRAITPVVIPDASYLRNAEHRELFLSGLRLASGEGNGVKPAPPRVDNPPDAAPIEPREAERRHITALFCELIGAPAGGDGTGLEDLREAIGDFHRCVLEVAGRHQGFVYRDLGNSALVLFGYPEAHEHDAEQAVRAGLELCAAVRTLRPHADAPVRCRVGVATGMIIVDGPVGAGAARSESIVGDAPNLAARLALSAPPDAVAVGPATRGLIGNLFDCRELGAVEAAGGTDPIRSWQVLGESIVESRFEALRGPALTPLVGRDEEIDLLLRRWARAKTGDGQVVLVSGEPGIGKSRIAAALEERLGGEPHLRLRYFCSPHHQDSALFPFVEQLAHAAGFARDDTSAAKLEKLEILLALAGPPDEDVALLADVLSLPASEQHPLPSFSPQQKKDRTLAALIRQLEGLARRQPVVTVFEDAHWIDPTSRELLDLTVERLRTLPVLLIVTFRPEFQPPWSGQEQVSTLALNRLGRHDRAVLVEQIAGGKALPEEVIAQIAERTDGVPLFVEELTKAVVEFGADRGYVSISAVPPSSLAVPATLHASLLGRLDRLGPVAKNVAQVGAAIGRDFSHELLAAAVQLAEPELQEALQRLVEAGLVFQRGLPPAAEYLFKHALVQDTAYSTLLRRPRQALHQRIAEALEERFPDLVETRPEILARHYGEAAMPDKAIAYWHLAGKLSVAKSAVLEAIAQLRRGLSLLDGLPETRERQQLELDIHVTLTAALMAGKGYGDPEVAAALERANRLVTETAAVETPLHFSVLYGLWVSTLNTGTIAAGLERATNFLSFAQSQPSSGPLLVAHRILAYSLMLSGDYRAALAHVETAASLHRPDEHRDSAFRYGQDIGVSAFVHLSWALWHRGYPDQSARVADRALALSRQLGHAHTLSYAFYFAGMAAVFARDVATVCARSNDCVTLASEHGFAQWVAYGRVLQGWADAQKSEATTGIARIRDGLVAREATGARAATPLFLTLLAEALALAGKIEEGLAALDDALAKAAVSGETGWDAEIHRLCGELTSRLAHPDPAKAEDSFRTALAIAREQGTRGYELRAATSLARLWREHGRRTEARDLLAPVYDWFTEGFDTADLKDAKALIEELAA